MNNREWLYGLDVADLAEWFDAEHVEHQEHALDGDTGALERKNADLINEYYKPMVAELQERADRLTAERDNFKANNEQLHTLAGEQAAKIDELQAERDEWKAKAEGSSKVRTGSSSAMRATAVERLRKMQHVDDYGDWVETIAEVVKSTDRSNIGDYGMWESLIDLLTDEPMDAQRGDNETWLNDADSREKIKADASELVADYAASGDVCDALHRGIIALLDRQAAITANETNHDNPYVGLVRGKQWERTEMSDYYCGRCGWKVTDHDSYCPECGGALHKTSNKPDSKFDVPKSEEIAENVTPKGEIRDFDDSREKLEADCTAAWKSVERIVRLGGMPKERWTNSEFFKLLDRQAAITEREWANVHDTYIADLRKERDDLKAQLDEILEGDKATDAINAELLSRIANMKATIHKHRVMAIKTSDLLRNIRDELAAVRAELAVVKAERDSLADDLLASNREREQLRKTLGVALDHAHDVLALADLDGEAVS